MTTNRTLPVTTRTATRDPLTTLEGASANVLLQILDRAVHDGTILFRYAGQERLVGQGACDPDEGPDFLVEVRDRRFFARVISEGNLGLAESYMAGGWDLRRGELKDFLTLLLKSRADQQVRGNLRLTLKVLGIRLLNAFRGRMGNVQCHYDIGDDLFESFLDPTMTYSCGYAEDEGDCLERMQTAKLERICQKLELRPGELLLDIGCGYGGLLIHAARQWGARGVGITNSRHHCERAQANAARAGVQDRVRIEFGDFRRIDGTFDKFVSVGMLEHLKPRDFADYFRVIARSLTEQGRGLVHAIGCNAPRLENDPFIQKYIFPGSGQPKLSEMAHHLEQNRLYILDVENLARHYALTADHWLSNFRRNQHTLDARKYDARFCRMWDYYLSAGVAAARASESALYQVLFYKDVAAPLALQRV